MRFTDIFIKRPVLATVVSLLILFLGIRSINDLPLRQFPKMENTVITISTGYPGANAELMQGFITSPIQQAIATADGIDYLTATSTESMSTVTAYIKLNYDPNTAMTDIMAKVAQVTDVLPKQSNKPVIRKETGSSISLMYIGFYSPEMTNQQITNYISRVVQPKLQTIGGVANAQILGGQTYAMRIWLNSEKMAAFNISAESVVNALQSQNYQAAPGQIKGKFVVYNVNATTNLTNVEQFKEIVVKSTDNNLIRMQDIAVVELGAQDYDSSVNFNGKNAVFIGIQSTPTANPLTVIDDVKKMLPELAINYPPQFAAKIVYDSTAYIRSSIHEVASSIIEAGMIVILVVFLFLGAFRTVTIPVLTIPLSLIGVCWLMYAMGYSLNLLTLLAMVLAIGLVVDDAIVVVENIYRHLEHGETPFDAAIIGAREITVPIISMTITLAAVYAPIGFMTGLTGALFKEFAFTLAFAVIISGVIALTLSPMMCSKILNKSIMEKPFVKKVDRFFDNFKNKYQSKLEFALSNRRMILVFAAIILLACGIMAVTTPTALAPDEDQSVIFISATAPEYANIDYLNTYTKSLDKIYQNLPETADYFIVNGMGAVNSAISGLMLKPWSERKRSQGAVQKEVQEQLGKIAGLNAVAFPLPSIPGSSDGLPVQFVLSTTADYTLLYQIMRKLLEKANTSGLFLFADADLKFEKPQLTVNIDKDKAGVMGISMESIANTLAIFMGGNYINMFGAEGNSYQVITQVPQQLRLNPEKIYDMYVPVGPEKKELVPLSSVVSLDITTIPNQLNQFQQLNSTTIIGVPAPGKSVPQVLDYLKTEANKIMPLGFSYDFAGQSRQAMQEGNALLYTFIFALIIIYLVLAAQFESFRDPFIVLISVPMSIAGALIPLNVGLATLNIYTGIGLITLIGLISKHGILMVDFANKLQTLENLTVTEAIIKSATLRLRPILMTTAAMVLGVIPLILANGAGANSRFDIGIVIAAGMLIGTLFTLFVLPTVYTILSNQRRHEKAVI